MECGEVYKLVADSNYTRVYRSDGGKEVLTKTLWKAMDLWPGFFLRINRKEAVNRQMIQEINQYEVKLINGEILKWSRRRLKKFDNDEKKHFSFLDRSNTKSFIAC